MNRKTTEDLIIALKKTADISDFILSNKNELIDKNLSRYLNELLIEKDLTKAEVIRQAQINDIYGYQIFQGIKSPSRDKLLSLCFGFKLNVEQTQALLKTAGAAPLYPRNIRDAVIIFAINQELDINDTNDLLYEMEQYTL